jgi:UDP-perosamine 4-acetyltransferase
MKSARCRVVVLGAGSHARAVAEVARAAGWTVAGFTDLAVDPARPEVLGRDEDVPRLARRHRLDGVLVGVGNTALGRRAELYQAFRTLAAPPLLHPRAAVTRSASLEAGTVVFAGVVVGAGVTVGANVVLYSGAVVEHDSRIGAHVRRRAWCGRVITVDEGVSRAGAVAIPGGIGAGAIVAAGAVVVADVPACATGSACRAQVRWYPR